VSPVKPIARKFVGRGRSVRNAEALDEGAELTGTVGAVLDPIFSLRVRVRIPPGASAHVAFTTFIAENKERAIELADLYHDPYSARRALDLSWAQAQAELRDLGIAPADAALYQDLAGHLMFPHPGFRPALRARSRRTSSGSRRCGASAFPVIGRSFWQPSKARWECRASDSCSELTTTGD